MNWAQRTRARLASDRDSATRAAPVGLVRDVLTAVCAACGGDGTGFALHRYQRETVNGVLCAGARHLLDVDAVESRERDFRVMFPGVWPPPDTLVTVGARRVGKTVALTIGVACLMLAAPGVSVGVVANKKDNARAIVSAVATILKHVRGLPRGARDASLVVNNVDAARTRGGAEIVATTAQGMRGKSFNVVVVDEAGFVGQDDFTTCVKPVLVGSPRSALVVASTPCDENAETVLTWALERAYANDRAVFTDGRLQCTSGECARARAAKGTFFCAHIPPLIPPHLNAARLVRLIKQAKTREEAAELLGTSWASAVSVFDAKAVRACLEAESLAPPPGAACVIAYDPAYGGRASRDAIVGLRVWMAGAAARVAVCYIDEFASIVQGDKLVRVQAAVDALGGGVLAIEGNAGDTAATLGALVTGAQIYRDRGFRMTQGAKNTGVSLLRRLFETRAIGRTADCCTRRLVAQLCGLRRHRSRVHGKTNGDTDDLAMAMIIAISVASRVF